MRPAKAHTTDLPPPAEAAALPGASSRGGGEGSRLMMSGHSCLFTSSTVVKRVIVAANGDRLVAEYCSGCGERLSEWLQHNGEDVNALEVISDYSAMAVKCQYIGCGEPASSHHVAPRYIFDDADNWPRVMLCKRHHTTWHEAVSDYRRYNSEITNASR